MEIQIAIWTPDETHSSVRSWQPILMIIIMTTLMTTSSSVEPCEAASHAQMPSRILLIGEGKPERFRQIFTRFRSIRQEYSCATCPTTLGGHLYRGVRA